MVLVLLGICIFAFLLFALWDLISDGRIREYRYANGEKIPGTVSEKLIVEINGAPNGLFINSKEITNPVLLFVSSGPGTDDYFLNEKYEDMHLEDLFTVVYWDYRGMGIAYDKEIDPDSITSQLIDQDLVAVTEYLKTVFDKEKIYLMGFSGGSKIALEAASAHPELFEAYIGMAQVVTDSCERDTLSYNFMKKVFEERNDHKSIKKLEGIVTHEGDMVKCNDWFSFVYLLHKAGGGTTMNESEFVGIDIPIFMAHCYTVREKINYIRGMKMYRQTPLAKGSDYDYRETCNKLEIPAYFISGEYDYNCPWPLVEDYVDKLDAPDKGFFLIENSAHSPLWENEAACFRILGTVLFE